MVIQNFKELATSPKKQDTLEILEAGLEAAMTDITPWMIGFFITV